MKNCGVKNEGNESKTENKGGIHMAGTTKPNIIGLSEEAKYKLLGYVSNYYSLSYTSNYGKGGEFLFDGVLNNGDKLMGFWGYNDYVEIEIFEQCNLWCHISDGSKPHIIILKKINNEFVDITKQYITHQCQSNMWTKAIENLDVGIYRFKTDPIYQSFDEWYFEQSKSVKFLVKQNHNYYDATALCYKLGLPTNNHELETWYKKNGIDDLNVLIKKKNVKSTNLQAYDNHIYKTISFINLNEITNKIEYININDKKEIKYNVKEYQLLDSIKQKIGNKFQIIKWEES